jgi:uncharacterized protein YjbJ (UPF0337 family)
VAQGSGEAAIDASEAYAASAVVRIGELCAAVSTAGELASTKDKIKGGFKEAKGKAKEKAGEATRNPDLRDRRTAEKAGGKVRRKIGDVKKVFGQ